ncbi:MAG: DUF167 domain-containing protein [Chlamydiales bacterium]|nr:DUF167 domain-containing protein [Chlamydiales bacterium]
MEIVVKVTPKAKKEEVLDEGEFLRVKVTAAPDKGEANRACIKLLAKHFDVPQRDVILIRGETARTKTFLIER